MSDFLKALDAHVSQADWDRMATHAGIPAADVKAKVVAGLQAFIAGAPVAANAQTALPAFKLGTPSTSGSCTTQTFDITLYDIIGIRGSLTLCGTSPDDWSAELQVCLVVAGASVWCTNSKFDSHNLGICFDINVAVAKVHLCFVLVIGSGRICFNINGQACVWAVWWHCENFNITPFCIPLP